MIPFHQRATSVPSKQLTWAHWVVSPCLWPLLLNTSFSHWFAWLETSLCKLKKTSTDKLFCMHSFYSRKTCYCLVNNAALLSLQYWGAEPLTGCEHPAASALGEQHGECSWDQHHFTGAHPWPIRVWGLSSPHLRAFGDRMLQHYCQSLRSQQVFLICIRFH